MTIQNIEDVMDRILTLNRNLTEDSLRTLLSASGWDKEDIMEGIRIFKSKNRDNSISSPATNLYSKMVEEDKALPIDNKEEVNTYTFNISKKDTSSTISSVNQSDTSAQEESGEINNTVTGVSSPGLVENKENKLEAAPNTNIPTQLPDFKEEPKKHSSVGRTIFFILLILILGFAIFYLYLFSSTKTVDYRPEIPAVKNNANSLATTSDNLNNSVSGDISSTGTGSNKIISKDDYSILSEEIKKLKLELDSYKKTTQTPKTIVKYISQKGPTGSTGRGISSVSATSTGFLITFTDKSTSLVPYSTTTIFNILNSNSVCFQDPVSPATSSNICLDRNSVINLLNK